MDKAIKLLKALLEPDAEDRMSFDDNAILAGHKRNREWVYAAEALAEIQAYKLKMDSLKSRCKSQIEEQKKNFYDSARGKIDAYADILQKLEELDK